MSAKYKSPSFLLPNELNTSANTANDTGINSLYSMDFNGSSDYIVSNDALITGNESRSISVWAKSSVSLTTNNNQVPFSLGTGSIGNKTKFAIKIRGSQRVQIDAKSYNVDFTSSYPGANWGSIDLNDGQWHHYVVTYATDDLKLYVDGTFIAGSTNYNSLVTQDGVLIGVWYRNGAFADYFPGQIDEVSVFNRVLNTTEIAALYDGTGSNIRPSNLIASNLNPIAYYPLGEQAQNTGYVGSGNPGNPTTLSNVWQFPNGVLQDYVMDFDGSTDYIDVSNFSSVVTNGNITLSMWFKTSSTSQQYLIATSQTYGTSCSLFMPSNGSGQLWFRRGNNTSSGEVTCKTSSGYNDGKWHNVICTSDSNMKIYVDGVLDIQATTSTPTVSDSQFLTIGVNGGSGTLFFDGEISNVAIWKTAITDTNEIADIYNNGSPQTTYTVTPQNWWKLNADSVYTPSAPNYTTALNFDGTDSVTVGSLFNQVQDVFSVSAWVNFTSNPGYQMILSDNIWFANYTANNIGLDIKNSSGSYYDNNGGLNQGTNFVIPSNLRTNKWIHVAFSYEGSSSGTTAVIKMYLNGNEMVNTTVTYSTGNANLQNASNFYLGSRNGTAFFLDGSISNVSIWNAALTSSQVSTLFNFGTPETNISFSPQAWWKLDNTTTGIQDSSGNGNNGTNNGTTQLNSSVAFVPSWKIPSALTIPTINYTTALEFNGTSSTYVDLNNITSLNGVSQASYSFWFKLTSSTPASGSTSVMLIGSNAKGASCYIYLNNFYIHNFNTKYITVSSGVPSLNQWHHICCVFNSGVAEAYLDGVSVGTVTEPTLTTTASDFGNNFNIGYSSFYSAWINNGGQISNLALFNSALTSSQVSTLYNAGTPETAISFSPVSWWKLDSTTITDSVGSNNGTNNGATQVTSDVYVGNIPVNGVSTTLPSTALQQSDLQFDSPYSNYSLSFDGTGDYIDCGSISSIPSATELTVSFWANTNSTSQSQVVFGDNSSTPIFSFEYWGSNNRMYFEYGSNLYAYLTLTSVVTAGSWHNVVLVYNASGASNTDKIKIYVDGVDKSSSMSYNGTIPSSLNASIGDFWIGNGQNYNQPFIGKIDETSIFNYALSSAQVLEIYNNGRPKDLTTFSGTAPISWWRLGENAYFDNNSFVVPNSISGAPNGTGSGTITTMISADAPGTYANGIGTNLDIVDRVGDAALSTANSQSYNMIPSDISPYVPGYGGDQISNTYSMVFDGINDYITIPNISLSGEFTLSWWMKRSNYANINNYFFGEDNANNANWIRFSNGDLDIKIGASSGADYQLGDQGTKPNFTFVNNNWYNIVITRDSNFLIQAYANGLVDPNYTPLRLPKSGATPVSFAPNTFGRKNTTYLDGIIDEVVIFDKALTAGQIYNDIYQPTATGTNQTADIANNPNLPTPVAWYRMGD